MLEALAAEVLQVIQRGMVDGTVVHQGQVEPRVARLLEHSQVGVVGHLLVCHVGKGAGRGVAGGGTGKRAPARHFRGLVSNRIAGPWLPRASRLMTAPTCLAQWCFRKARVRKEDSPSPSSMSRISGLRAGPRACQVRAVSSSTPNPTPSSPCACWGRRRPSHSELQAAAPGHPPGRATSPSGRARADERIRLERVALAGQTGSQAAGRGLGGLGDQALAHLGMLGTANGVRLAVTQDTSQRGDATAGGELCAGAEASRGAAG